MDDYGVTEAELQEINDEFEEKERKGDAVDEEAERKALAEINWAINSILDVTETILEHSNSKDN